MNKIKNDPMLIGSPLGIPPHKIERVVHKPEVSLGGCKGELFYRGRDTLSVILRKKTFWRQKNRAIIHHFARRVSGEKSNWWVTTPDGVVYLDEPSHAVKEIMAWCRVNNVVFLSHSPKCLPKFHI